MKYLLILLTLFLSSCATVDMEKLNTQCENICRSKSEKFVCVRYEQLVSWRGPVNGSYMCVCSNSEEWL
jgi:hypothetical protein